MPDRDCSCPARLGQEGRTTIPELGQPVMVVVLVVIARTATAASRAVVVFRANGRAANIADDCSGSHRAADALSCEKHGRGCGKGHAGSTPAPPR